MEEGLFDREGMQYEVERIVRKKSTRDGDVKYLNLDPLEGLPQLVPRTTRGVVGGGGGRQRGGDRGVRRLENH